MKRNICVVFSSIAVLRKKMSTFISDINPITGKSSWVEKDERYDYHQEIARSAYADMLHDTERNKKYFLALERAIQLKRKAGERVNVLDIGTGTGLLSMMAASLGADTITACEAFNPMAECARKIIEKNGFSKHIKLVPKRSTELKVGQDGDMPVRANILVTEVFDTELIGEGAISTYSHAHKELLEKDCIVVPTSSDMYIQVVSSKLIKNWKEIQPITISPSDSVNTPPEMRRCSGAISLHDLQLQQLPRNQFTCLSPPIKVFHFDLSGTIPLVSDRQTEETFTALAAGQTDGILMWWDLQMDTQGEIDLSCAPDWAHPNPQELQWRDHWMQAVYYPSTGIKVEKGEDVKVISNHSEYNLWFDVSKDKIAPESSPDCTCGIHTAISRTRIGMMNDPIRRRIWVDVLRNNITPDAVCLCISDGSLLPLVAAKLGCKKVFAIESNPLCRRITESFIKENKCQGQVKVIDKHPEEVTCEDLENLKVDLVIGEPFFQTSVLPWHHFQFWYSINCMSQLLTPSTKVLPYRMTIYALAVDFLDLWKIRAPVGICEGFDLDIFDKLIEKSSDIADEVIEPHPLWEYPCTACGDVIQVYSFCFTDIAAGKDSNYCSTVELDIESCGRCNGVVLWADYDFGDNKVISTGPRERTVIGQKVKWDYYGRQGVHLLKDHIHRDKNQKCAIKVKCQYEPFKSDDFMFSFTKVFH